ncbi:hypothetical protein GE21DRAFT_218 [Neurospora crassa]|uniref:F-box domain-containing protein n=1 Tax=Neurospora crassa (strain ATCC 24698 / 74-OR23-1A / CBS 708.71 / DSM 1257 / FGSC 987) TaxID=367110 RepID=Q7SFQ8_NEUCR|nr:hypothetical protein NCU09092 [Neurospora crassa OR74A]EAA35673.1 hypothetical protein NCU09092 [Neurospora crassa OR74A]KHE82460.1 hypothetical protein GE21DRAFT_218 [Neurospora crassa]|eukprot:XP_964909.1 hypothetical protein NCU09092 [Neurospora crassa OR74A]
MKLTPIKVRGRGGRKQPWQPPNPERFRRKYLDGDEDEFDEETGVIPSQVDKNGVRRRRRVKTRKPAALIEQLPPEILERIFSMSENLNFPRSSLRIGYMLSARTFLMQLIVDAFSPTWDMWFGCPRKDIHSYRSYEKDGERMPGSPDFQTAILSSKWFSLSLILHAQQVWIRRHGSSSRPFIHTENWLMLGPTRMELDRDLISGPRPGEIQDYDMDDVRDVYSHHPHHRLHFDGHFFDDSGAPSSSQSYAKLDVETCFEADWSWFTTILNKFDPQGVIYSMENHALRTGYWDIHPATKIPNHLLANPVASWDSVKLLYWLVRGGATLSSEQTWELTKLGYECLMSHPDHPSTTITPSYTPHHSTLPTSRPYIPHANLPPDARRDDLDEDQEREQMSLIALRLFSILRVFGPNHWPHFLMIEKLEEISVERQTRTAYSDSQKPAWKLWLRAQSVLRHWMQQRGEEHED